jgi:hypothetical protein
VSAFVGRQGRMKPTGTVRVRNMPVFRAADAGMRVWSSRKLGVRGRRDGPTVTGTFCIQAEFDRRRNYE